MVAVDAGSTTWIHRFLRSGCSSLFRSQCGGYPQHVRHVGPPFRLGVAWNSGRRMPRSSRRFDCSLEPKVASLSTYSPVMTDVPDAQPRLHGQQAPLRSSATDGPPRCRPSSLDRVLLVISFVGMYAVPQSRGGWSCARRPNATASEEVKGIDLGDDLELLNYMLNMYRPNIALTDNPAQRRGRCMRRVANVANVGRWRHMRCWARTWWNWSRRPKSEAHEQVHRRAMARDSGCARALERLHAPGKRCRSARRAIRPRTRTVGVSSQPVCSWTWARNKTWPGSGPLPRPGTQALLGGSGLARSLPGTRRRRPSASAGPADPARRHLWRSSGAGKDHTVMCLLRELLEKGVPFLIFDWNAITGTCWRRRGFRRGRSGPSPSA